MSEQATRTPGRIVWHELMSEDVERSIEFYCALFGWRVEGYDMGPGGMYRLIRNGEDAIGGILRIDPDDPAPSHWLAYTNVEDVDATVEKARAHGGDVTVPGMDILGKGRFAVIRDPLGARICTWHGEREEPPECDGPATQGNFCWNELTTPDALASRNFYQAIFGWSPAPLDPENPDAYAFFLRSEKKCDAAVMQTPPGVENPEAGWISFVAVDDVDAMLSKAQQLGATLSAAPTDTPGGRYCVLLDPTGANFAIYQPPPKD